MTGQNWPYLDMLTTVDEVLSGVKYWWYIIHFYHHLFSVTPRSKVKDYCKYARDSTRLEVQTGFPLENKGHSCRLRSIIVKAVSKNETNGIKDSSITG